MRLPYTNAVVSLKRRAATSGNKKANEEIQTGIPVLLSDTGTTADHEQTYVIMISTDDLAFQINPDTDSISDGTSDYKIENVARKSYHVSIRAIKAL
jgi:hypothetical protein